jgi:hypothetical protein
MMKKIFTPLFLLLVAASNLVAQNVDDQKLVFKYFQLPTNPIKGQSFYSVVVDHSVYTKSNEDSLALYNNNPNSYQAQMNRWLDDVKKIDKAYFLEMAKWEKATNAGQVMAQPPKQPYPPMPNVTTISTPILTSEMSENIINSNVNIGGMTKGFEGVIVTLQPQGFQAAKIIEKKTGTGATTKYEYSSSYKMPIKVTVEVPGQGIIFNEILNNDVKTKAINSYASRYEYEFWKTDNYLTYWETAQKTALTDALTTVNNRLNDMYGTYLVTRVTEAFTVKKYQNHDYGDLIEAFTQAKQGYDKLFININKAEAIPYLRNAISIWEKALAEHTGAKKERVTDKVFSLLCVNLAEAYLWLDEFSQAEIYILKAIQKGNAFDRYRGIAEKLQPLVNNQKARFLANQ